MSAIWFILGCIVGGSFWLAACGAFFRRIIDGKQTYTTKDGRRYKMVEVKDGN